MLGRLIICAILLAGALPSAARAAERDQDRPRIVAFGDSLTAGLGVGPDEAYPAQLQRRLDEFQYRYRVVNAGVSGETTAGAVRRLPWILKTRPDIVIVEFGGNDGLRGLSLAQTEANIDRIIRELREAGVSVVLVGMKLPPNYGAEYTSGFEALYHRVAQRHRVAFMPFFLEGVAGSATLNQADGIHPTKDGYTVIAEQVFNTLRPLLGTRQSGT